jgi:hypothetical protein
MPSGSDLESRRTRLLSLPIERVCRSLPRKVSTLIELVPCIDVSPSSIIAHTPSPAVPIQDNSWDCGVFVCMYSYGIYLLRHCFFTYLDTNAFAKGGKTPFQELITESAEFTFGMPDIARIRLEMKTLIERLSGVYLPFKLAERRAVREEKQRQATACSMPTRITRSATAAGSNESLSK